VRFADVLVAVFEAARGARITKTMGEDRRRCLPESFVLVADETLSILLTFRSLLSLTNVLSVGARSFAYHFQISCTRVLISSLMSPCSCSSRDAFSLSSIVAFTL